jgi:hypothetical protein
MADLNSIKDNILTYLSVGSNDVECNTCCPECGDIYVFASAETFLKWAEAVDATAPTGTAPIISETPCCYERCITELYDYVGSAENIESILQTGIAEYSTIQGQSFVCLLLDFADENNLSGDKLTELLVYILNIGVVVSCINGNTVVSSVETWLKWAEVVLGDSGRRMTCKKACCLSTTTSIETYVKLAEALGWLPLDNCGAVPA